LFRFPTTSQGNKRSSKNEKKAAWNCNLLFLPPFQCQHNDDSYLFHQDYLFVYIYLPLGLLFLRSVLLFLFNRKTWNERPVAEWKTSGFLKPEKFKIHTVVGPQHTHTPQWRNLAHTQKTWDTKLI
jgi:hypothetical protein